MRLTKEEIAEKYALLSEEMQKTVCDTINSLDMTFYHAMTDLDEEIKTVKGIADILWIFREAGEKGIDIQLRDIDEGLSFLFNSLWAAGNKLAALSDIAYKKKEDKEVSDNV